MICPSIIAEAASRHFWYDGIDRRTDDVEGFWLSGSDLIRTAEPAA